MSEKKGDKRLARLSLDPLSVDDALRGALAVPASEDGKPKKRKARKKRAKKKAGR